MTQTAEQPTIYIHSEETVHIVTNPKPPDSKTTYIDQPTTPKTTPPSQVAH